MKDFMGIYSITNTLTNKIYIGSSVHIKRRWAEHKSRLVNRTHPNPHLQYSFNKDGISNFKFEIIEVVKDKNILLEREQFWLDKTNVCDRTIGFNINQLATGGGLYGADNPMYGISPRDRMDEFTYKKWLEARSGENAPKPMLGKQHTEESKEKMSQSRIGKYKHSEQWKKQHSKMLTGRKYTEEHKRHISESKLAKTSKNDVAVTCLEKQNTYCTLSEAARQMNVSKSAIFNAINGKSKTCCGFHWVYAQT